MTSPLEPSQYRAVVSAALTEDVGSGDITSEATVDAAQQAHGVFVAKAPCVVAGLDVAFETFRQRDARIQTVRLAGEGDWRQTGDPIGRVAGAARALLSGERTALNFLQRLSGIATLARRFSEAAEGRIVVLDTRKTTPTLRLLEKYAVRVGGATNHRFGLYDAILIKDNHVRLAGGVAMAVRLARKRFPGLPVEVEAQSLAEVDEALEVGVDILLVDNLSVDEIRCAVERARGRTKVEISGGVTLDRVPKLATTGADFVSAGALTHSAPASDISFEIEPA